MPLPDAGAKSQPPAPRERVGVYGIEPVALGSTIESAVLALELVAPGEELISEAERVQEPTFLVCFRRTPICLRHGAYSTSAVNSDG